MSIQDVASFNRKHRLKTKQTNNNSHTSAAATESSVKSWTSLRHPKWQHQRKKCMCANLTVLFSGETFKINKKKAVMY